MTEVVLSGIYIYPIKSAGGISLSTAVVEDRGLQHDRRFMIVDSQGKFLTQRQFPQMALITTQLQAESLIVSAPEMSPLSVPLVPEYHTRILVQVWRDHLSAISVGKTASAWFSEFLGITCQLVYMAEDSQRFVESEYAANNLVSFADGFPFLLTSEASLQNLNQHLAHPVNMSRFRPNFVVTGKEAFAEDSWQLISINSILFEVAKSCARCSIVTVDQATGEKGQEPLSTLASYRLYKGEILFGQNLIAQGNGVINLGDRVEVRSDIHPHT